MAMEHAALAAEPHPSEEEVRDVVEDAAFLQDDLLKLIFICCTLGATCARLVLTLRAVAGLTVAEIGHALLIEERAAEQRLTRAKRLVRELSPPTRCLRMKNCRRGSRLCSGLSTWFQRGLQGEQRRGSDPIRVVPRCHRLGRTLCRLFPSGLRCWAAGADAAYARALRRALHHTGEIVLLDRQDRSLWTAMRSRKGKRLSTKRCVMESPAVSGAGCNYGAALRSPRRGSTDWKQIALLYETLERMQPSPVVTVNAPSPLQTPADPSRVWYCWTPLPDGANCVAIRILQRSRRAP